jgi:hypothetical protein
MSESVQRLGSNCAGAEKKKQDTTRLQMLHVALCTRKAKTRELRAHFPE